MKNKSYTLFESCLDMILSPRASAVSPQSQYCWELFSWNLTGSMRNPHKGNKHFNCHTTCDNMFCSAWIVCRSCLSKSLQSYRWNKHFQRLASSQHPRWGKKLHRVLSQGTALFICHLLCWLHEIRSLSWTDPVPTAWCVLLIHTHVLKHLDSKQQRIHVKTQMHIRAANAW